MICRPRPAAHGNDSHGVGVDIGRGSFLSANTAREIAEVIDGQGKIGVKRLAHRLAVVPGLGDGQHLEVVLDTLGDLQQQVGTLGDGRLPPGGSRGVGRIQGLVDVLDIGTRDLADHLAVDRADVVEIAPLHRRHELTPDIVAVARGELDQAPGVPGLA